MSYHSLPSQTIIQKTAKTLKAKHFETKIVASKQEALEIIKQTIPKGASVMNGASATLEQIGFVDYLKSKTHGWNNLHELILSETDPVKQGILRKQSTVSDYYLGSVHALTQSGDLIIASNTGSQLPHIVYNSQNLIFVIGAQKIVKDLENGMKRLESYVIPLEDKRMQAAYGMGTQLNKILILKGDPAFLGRKITIVLVNEVLGY